MSYGISRQIPDFSPNEPQISNSFRGFLSFMWTFYQNVVFVNSIFHVMSTVDSILNTVILLLSFMSFSNEHY